MLLPFGLKPLFKECDPPFVAMLKSRSKFFLHAKVGRTGADDEEFDDAQAGHPIERRLNRLERVSAAYRGQINLRFNNGMLVTFDSANAALLAIRILALSDEALSERLQDWRAAKSAAVAEVPEG